MAPKFHNWDDVMEFENSPFDGKSDVWVIEEARIKGNVVPGTDPPYRRQSVIYLVGKSPDGETRHSHRRNGGRCDFRKRFL